METAGIFLPRYGLLVRGCNQWSVGQKVALQLLGGLNILALDANGLIHKRADLRHQPRVGRVLQRGGGQGAVGWQRLSGPRYHALKMW